MPVDPDRAGLEAGGDLLGLVPVGGPDGGAESDVDGVGPRDRLLEVGVADDRQGRAELLLLDQRRVVVDVGHQGLRVEVARLAGVGVAARHQAGAAALGVLDETVDHVPLHLVLQRAEQVGLVQSDAHRHLGRERGQRVDDLIVDGVGDVQPLERGAGLPVVDERAPEQALRDPFGVDVGEHDARVVAAELQGEPGQVARAGLDDLDAGPDRAGEHDLAARLSRTSASLHPGLPGQR